MHSEIPGDIWIVEIWTVKTGLGLRYGRVTVSYDCPVYDFPDFDCAIKTCNQGTAAPHFLAYVYCRQKAGWIICSGPCRYVSARTTLC